MALVKEPSPGVVQLTPVVFEAVALVILTVPELEQVVMLPPALAEGPVTIVKVMELVAGAQDDPLPLAVMTRVTLPLEISLLLGV